MNINTFDDYLNEPCALHFDQMKRFHQEMIDEIGMDPKAVELYDDLVSEAGKYAAIRASWQQMSREEKMEKDSLRTSIHNSVIIHFNMLARYLRMQGKKQNGEIASDMKRIINSIERQSVILDVILCL